MSPLHFTSAEADMRWIVAPSKPHRGEASGNTEFFPPPSALALPTQPFSSPLPLPAGADRITEVTQAIRSPWGGRTVGISGTPGQGKQAVQPTHHAPSLTLREEEQSLQRQQEQKTDLQLTSAHNRFNTQQVWAWEGHQTSVQESKTVRINVLGLSFMVTQNMLCSWRNVAS